MLVTGSSGQVGRAVLPALERHGWTVVPFERDAQPGAFVHVDDVATAAVQSLHARVDGHVRVTLCGPGDFDTSAARAGHRLARHETMACVTSST